MTKNSTQVSYIILTAYFDTGHLKYFYFISIVFIYILVLGANVLLIVVICMNRSLHEPMYMFLCSLFVNELLGSTGLFPFLLVQILSDAHIVSVPLCLLQIYCLYLYGNVEFYTLGVMSYDRYVAICFPLQYNTRMTCGKVAKIISGIWLYSALYVGVSISLTIPLPLCGNIINKVYCDYYPIAKLACSDSTASKIYELVYLFTVIFSVVFLILFTYMKILKVCLCGSKQTRQKAISTCAPHLASLLNFSFGAFFELTQTRFNMSHLPNMLRVFLSIYWLTCTPLLNPLLYGLNMSKIRNICIGKVEELLSSVIKQNANF
ncbi:olfactory receptor 4B13-like [Pholidichthys leucotaenia]